MLFNERPLKKVGFAPAGRNSNYETWSYKKKEEKKIKRIQESCLETAHRKKVSVNCRLKVIQTILP